jgi:alanyl-tRNA synthetase
LKVDEEGFKEELKVQQERSRGARSDNESMAKNQI